MIFTSKNGVRLEVRPDNYWKWKDWVAFCKAVWFIKHNNITMDSGEWSGHYASST